MIFDRLEHSKQYENVHPRFKAAFEFIRTAVEENYEVGRYEIDGTNLYAIVQAYNSKQEADAKNEAHKRYIDIQYVVSGMECIDSTDLCNAEPKTEYDPVKDVQFYHPATRPTRSVLQVGDYGIYFPHDVHRPGMCLNGDSQPVKKIVVKILNKV